MAACRAAKSQPTADAVHTAADTEGTPREAKCRSVYHAKTICILQSYDVADAHASPEPDGTVQPWHAPDAARSESASAHADDSRTATDIYSTHENEAATTATGSTGTSCCRCADDERTAVQSPVSATDWAPSDGPACPTDAGTAADAARLQPADDGQTTVSPAAQCTHEPNAGTHVLRIPLSASTHTLVTDSR